MSNQQTQILQIKSICLANIHSEKELVRVDDKLFFIMEIIFVRKRDARKMADFVTAELYQQ